MNRSLRSLIALLAVVALPAVAGAQINSNLAQVQLNASAPSQALSVSVTPSQVGFALSSLAPSHGDQVLQVTTTYNQLIGNVGVRLAFYFLGNAALTNGASVIGASQVFGSIDGVLPAAPFTSQTVFGGLGLQKSFVVNGSGSNSTSLDMSIDATGMTIEPGVYTGVLFIQAQAL